MVSQSNEPSAAPLSVLILGASYGSLFATKLAMAGHHSQLVCLPAEEQLINSQGTVIRIPVKGLADPVELRSSALPGNVTACSATEATPEQFDLIVLAMQEPQYRVTEVRDLLQKVAKSRVPCMSIMNMPPLPFLARLPDIDTQLVESAYTDASVWENFDPALMTLASPDPQAFRPPDEPANVLQVGLPTNFKVARFDSEIHTQLLQRLERDITNARFEINSNPVEIPVKLKVHESVFVPLAKWLMLITGNYRCVLEDNVRPIFNAVHDDPSLSHAVYHAVADLCIKYGATAADLVPFEKYANAAKSLQKPSSAARALLAGAENIERVDKLVQILAARTGNNHPEFDAIVNRVDQWLERNRAQTTAKA